MRIYVMELPFGAQFQLVRLVSRMRAGMSGPYMLINMSRVTNIQHVFSTSPLEGIVCWAQKEALMKSDRSDFSVLEMTGFRSARIAHFLQVPGRKVATSSDLFLTNYNRRLWIASLIQA